MAKTIFGAGNSAANPVKLQVLCEDKRAMIPFIIKNEDKSDACDTKITFEDHRHEVTFTDNCDCRSKIECGKYADYDKKTGSFTYDNLTVYYELELITDPCPDTPQCVTSCSVGNYWMTKSDDNLLVSYEKYTIKDCGDYADVKKEIKHQTVACSTDDITISDECGSFTFKYECPTGCTGSGSTVINIRGTSFTPLFVEYTGGKVNVLISYEKIVTDENCNEHKTRGSVILEAEVKPCDEQLINMCCLDHSADVEILKTDLLKALGIEGAAATGVIVNYKGEEIADKLILSIMQKANPGPECNKYCNYVTTYCVLEDGTHIIKVEYETYWGSRVWITKEAGGKISSAGGRVKISFDYLATAIAFDDEGYPITNKEGQKIDHSGNTIVDKEGKPVMEDVCKPYEYNGSDNVIIEVGPCSGEETEVDCGTTVTVIGDILYKDRSSWCDETEHVKPYTYTDIISHEEFVMNQITYEVEQDCSGVCDPGEYKVYEPIDLNIDKCATLAEGDVPWKKIKVDENCLVTTAETGTEHIVIQVEPNQTTKPIIFTNEYFRITQAAGPCDEGLSCGCDAVKILSGEYPDVCDKPTYVFETVNITCKEHDMVEVPFKGYCNGVAVYEGKYKWEHYFACNSGTDEITHTKDVNGGQIKVVQAGGCTSCGEPPTPPTPPTPTDCKCSVSMCRFCGQGGVTPEDNAAKKDGYGFNHAKVIGEIKLDDSCGTPTFDIVGVQDTDWPGDINVFKQAWSTVSLTVVKPGVTLPGGDVTRLLGTDTTHCIVASYIPPNTSGKIHVHFFASCREKENDYTSFYQNGGGQWPCTEEFECLIMMFNTIVTIPDNGPTYNYLHELYKEAKAQQQGTSQHGLVSLYKQENFPLPEIHKNNVYGSTENTGKAFSAMTAWLFAMQLAELAPKKRNELYTLGYNLGGDLRSNMFGYKFNSDPNVARLVGSAIYTTMRSTQNPDIAAMRTEIGGSSYTNTPLNYLYTTITTTEMEVSQRKYRVGENDFFVDVRQFMPGAPGPYLDNYASRPTRGTIGDAKVTNIEGYNGNTVVDYNIHTGITSTYKLTSTDAEIKTRTVQAIADKETCPAHYFGSRKPTSHYGYIYPVFGKHNGCSDTDIPADKTNFNSFGQLLGDIASRQRGLLQNAKYVNESIEYGRRRPGETTTDGISKDGDEGILCNPEIQNADGCRDDYYDQDGNYVPIDSSSYSDEELCEYEHKQVWANSYPSGHSAHSWMNALLLMELYPGKADKIMAAGNTFAINRTIARYHYTSDTIMGRLLATTMFPVCHAAVTDYNTRLTQSKQELGIQ